MTTTRNRCCVAKSLPLHCHHGYWIPSNLWNHAWVPLETTIMIFQSEQSPPNGPLEHCSFLLLRWCIHWLNRPRRYLHFFLSTVWVHFQHQINIHVPFCFSPCSVLSTFSLPFIVLPPQAVFVSLWFPACLQVLPLHFVLSYYHQASLPQACVSLHIKEWILIWQTQSKPPSSPSLSFPLEGIQCKEYLFSFPLLLNFPAQIRISLAFISRTYLCCVWKDTGWTEENDIRL